MTELKDHQVRALADLYVRARGRALQVQNIYLDPPVPLEQDRVLAWDWERQKAEGNMGALWHIPCRAGKTRAALSALYHWANWLNEWGIVPDLQQRWNHPHLVLVPGELVRDGPFPEDWQVVVPPWDWRVNIWKPDREVRGGMYCVPTMNADKIDHLFRIIPPASVVVLTYPTLLARQDVITRHKWQVVVADEVHRLKDPFADWTKAAYRLNSVFRLGMSATPFTNYPLELREVLAFVQGWTVEGQRVSAIWPSTEQWKAGWCDWSYVPGKQHYRRIPAGALHPEYLYHKLRAEVMFSATRDEVSDAPDPIIYPLPVPLSAKQAEVYEDLKQGVLRWMDGHGKVSAVDTGPVIAQFSYLFQLCADARQLELSINKDADNILSHTNIPQTFSAGWALADQNSKLKALLWILDKVADTSEQVLVLTGYARLAKILTRDLLRLGYDAESITGDSKDRAGAVRRFATGETRVVVCTRAAWEGISLRAPYAVLMGFVDHTPGLVKQALLRAWNMFDDAPVTVYDVYAPGTVEEWNRQRLHAKDKFSAVMTNGREATTFSSVADISAALDGKFTGVN